MSGEGNLGNVNPDQTGWAEQRALVMHFVQKHETEVEDLKGRIKSLETEMVAAKEWLRDHEQKLDKEPPSTQQLQVGATGWDQTLGQMLKTASFKAVEAAIVLIIGYALWHAMHGASLQQLEGAHPETNKPKPNP